LDPDPLVRCADTRIRIRTRNITDTQHCFPAALRLVQHLTVLDTFIRYHVSRRTTVPLVIMTFLLQVRANVWKDSKGYELVYKYCECNCRRGCLKKDIDYVNEVFNIYQQMLLFRTQLPSLLIWRTVWQTIFYFWSSLTVRTFSDLVLKLAKYKL
jgi:hypothetical protein